MGFTGTTWGIIIAYQRGYVGIDSMIMNSKQYVPLYYRAYQQFNEL